MFNIQDGFVLKGDLVLIPYKNINGKAAGLVNLSTIPSNGKVFVPILGWVGLQAASGVTTMPTISVGQNASAYDDIVAATPMTGLQVGKLTPLPFRTQWPWLTGGTQPKLNISVAGAASGAITFTVLFAGVWL